MNTHESFKNRAESLKKGRLGGGWYGENYNDITLADLLFILEDDNWHVEETIVECLATQNYSGLLVACGAVLAREQKGFLPQSISEDLRRIDDENRNAWKGDK